MSSCWKQQNLADEQQNEMDVKDHMWLAGGQESGKIIKNNISKMERCNQELQDKEAEYKTKTSKTV